MRQEELLAACSTCTVPLRARNVIEVKRRYDLGHVVHNFAATALERALISEPEELLDVPFKLAVGWDATANNTLITEVVWMFCGDVDVETLWDFGRRERFIVKGNVLRREVLPAVTKRNFNAEYRRIRSTGVPVDGQ